MTVNGPRQANLVLIAYASSEGSGEPAHPRSLARTFAARSYKQWVERNLQTESQIPGPSEWLGMRSWNLSWRNARRHKFVWRGSNKCAADGEVHQAPLDLSIEHGLTKVHNQPTRDHNMLDLVFTNNPSTVKPSTSVPGISDNAMVVPDIDIIPQYIKQKPKRFYIFSKSELGDYSRRNEPTLRVYYECS